MISRLVVELKTLSKEKIDYNIGSALQGVLMKIIDTEYADKLHEQSLNPYSQYFFKNKDKLYWIINTFTKEARENIIKPFLENRVDDFFIKYKSERFTYKIVDIRDISYDDLQSNISNNKFESYIYVEFITPTSFKSSGEYKFIPDEKWIISSIYNKLKTFSKIELDEDIILSLIKNIRIVDYNLKSRRFNLEGVRIPSFMGNIKLSTRKCSYKEREYASLIFSLAPYYGIGIKTSIGMGAVRIIY